MLPGDHVMSGLLLTLRVVCCVQQLSLLVLPVFPVGPGLNSAYLQVCVKCPADSPRIAAWLPCGTWPPAARLLRAVWCPCGACLASRGRWCIFNHLQSILKTMVKPFINLLIAFMVGQIKLF